MIADSSGGGKLLPSLWPDDRAAALASWIERRFPGRDSEAARRARFRRGFAVAAGATVAVLVTGSAVVLLLPSSARQLGTADDGPWLGTAALGVSVVGLVVIVIAIARSRLQPGLSAHERHTVGRLHSNERRELRAEMRRRADAPAEDQWALDTVARTW